MQPIEAIWQDIKQEALCQAQREPFLASYFHSSIIGHNDLGAALSYLLANQLGDETMPAISLREVILGAYLRHPQLVEYAAHDICAVKERDPAIEDCSTVLLYLKGYKALQAHRVSHCLWSNNRKALALYLQSRVSATYGVDIHPAAQIGKGVMFDHASGIVVGETCVIEDNVSILQSVTLGGTGNEVGDRHPKIRQGVMIGAGAKVLGNIEVGAGAKIGAGSVVLSPVAPHTTVVGIPAKVVGSPSTAMPALDMDQNVLKD
ncbi:serine O-acetyltransferase [Paraferrimonas sedimenticola]|uniref:Serine acetyltransferase n=1 Tax=Paraferrimonas sedimenticola TaxID=375674 RepID=A0AA37RU63_9GAMM|nr:serine O-acetyltransferase [Paraferrimonas sedimenticola]GLP95840.1 serine O-acetyltransferase [Paraferrimonas sedimenticola]